MLSVPDLLLHPPEGRHAPVESTKSVDDAMQWCKWAFTRLVDKNCVTMAELLKAVCKKHVTTCELFAGIGTGVVVDSIIKQTVENHLLPELLN